MLPHYSPLKVAETFTILAGAVSRAGSTSGSAARRRHRPDDHVRAAARPPPGRARRLPPAARRAARLLRGLAPRRPSVRAAGGHASRAGPSCPRRGCSARRCRARSGPASSALPYAFADFINPGGAEIAAAYRERFAPTEESPRAADRGRRLDPVRRHRRGGPAARVQQPDDDDAAAARAADPGAAAREGARVPRARGQDGRQRGAGSPRRSSARRRRSAPESRSLRWPTAPRR